MTIVEFFEKSPFENMISCLACKPEKVIFMGDLKQMDIVIPTYEKFLKDKGIKTKIDRKAISRTNLQAAVQTLTDIIKTEKDCVFDIAGGDDLLILAIGIVFAVYREKYPFKLQKFDLENGKMIDCDCDNEVSFKGTFTLTVEELISLYGGAVLPEHPQPDPKGNKRDVDMLWDIARNKLKDWNDSVKYMTEFEKRTYPSTDRMHINIDLARASEEMADYARKLRICKDFLKDLRTCGAIFDLQITDDRISYNHKNSITRRCLNSPGDVLEMKVLFEARNLQKDGKPFFDSCYIGVNIDWVDGDSKITKNEIDVILMRGLTPVFISCKIGTIQEIEPYKLWTVAERFGGKHVKKVLIASDFNRNSDTSERSFLNRTLDMGITFIANATKMTDEEWRLMLKNQVSW